MKVKILAPLAAVLLGAAGFAAATFATGETTGTVTAAVPDRVVTIAGTTVVQTYTIPTVTETVTVTAPPPPPPPAADQIAFPRNSEYLSFNFGDGSEDSHFQMNTVRGCNPAVADRSFALNPNQINSIVPGTSVSSDGIAPGPNCGNEDSFAVSYGRGYDTITAPIVSPYPGIGTIRVKDSSACLGGDYMCTAAGVRISPGVLDFSNSAGIDTPAWTAKLRAHFYLKDLSTGNHPGVHGLWGDNFLWSNPYFRGDHEGTDADIDNGSVHGAQVLNSLLPPGTFQGANAQGLECGGIGSFAGSPAGAECSSVGDTGLWEGNAGYTIIHVASKADPRIDGFMHWLSTPSGNGMPKRGVISGNGTCGTNNVGHVLTAQDQRAMAAFAFVGGFYITLHNDCSWDTSAIPGTASGPNFAIPQLGDTAAFPRGWLGLPTGDPVKVNPGQWKRTFAGGIVYFNAVNAPWSVDGRTVPAWDGLFVKT